MKMQLEEINPDRAYQILERNTKNRDVIQRYVEKYARDMRSGKWRSDNPHGIIIDCNGVVIDGQHRLWAVIESNCTIAFYVYRDVRPEVRGVIDCGLARTTAQQITLGSEMRVTNMQCAIAKRVLRDRLHAAATAAEVQLLIATHIKAIEFAEAAFTRKVRGVTTAPVLTVLMRAYYHADHDRLRRFAELLQDARFESLDDEAVRLLRIYLTERAPAGNGGQQVIYAKTERALLAYLQGERPSTLYPASNEMFPLPEEKTAKKRVAAKGNHLASGTLVVGKKLAGANQRRRTAA